MPSFLEVIAACDSFSPAAAVAAHTAIPLHIAGAHVGYVPDFLLPAIEDLMSGPDEEETGFSMIYAVPEDPDAKPYLEMIEFDAEGTMGFLRRTKVMDALLRHWRAIDAFPCLRGWREERYPVYGEARTSYHDALSWDGVGKQPADGARPLPRNMIMTIERSGAELFGIRTFGAHLTGYIVDNGEIKIWVAQRSPTKQTYPGMLDNTVAGGIPCDQTPTEAIIRECAEEAGIPEELAKRAKPVGAITYNTTSRLNGISPEAQYIYDLELPADFVPKPEDGEVSGFKLCGVEEVCHIDPSRW